MLINSNDSYGSITKLFHWTMAIIILCLLVVGFLLEDLKMPILYKAHKAIGFLILLLAIARLLWRFANIVPGYDKSLPKWVALSAHIFHYGLYALMILLPLSAFIASNAAQYPVSFMFLFDMPSLFSAKDPALAKTLMQAHSVLAIILVAAILAHLLAGLYHHFVRKDQVLLRMWPFKLKK